MEGLEFLQLEKKVEMKKTHIIIINTFSFIVNILN